MKETPPFSIFDFQFSIFDLQPPTGSGAIGNLPVRQAGRKSEIVRLRFDFCILF